MSKELLCKADFMMQVCSQLSQEGSDYYEMKELVIQWNQQTHLNKKETTVVLSVAETKFLMFKYQNV